MLKFRLHLFLINAFYYSLVLAVISHFFEGFPSREQLLPAFILLSQYVAFTPFLLVVLDPLQKSLSKSIKFLSLSLLIWLIALLLFSIFDKVLYSRGYLGTLLEIYHYLLLILGFLVWFLGKKNPAYWGRYCRLSCLWFFLFGIVLFIFRYFMQASNNIISLNVLLWLYPAIYSVSLIGFIFGCLEIPSVLTNKHPSVNLLGFSMNLMYFFIFLNHLRALLFFGF